MSLLKRGINYRFGKAWLIHNFILMPALAGTAILLSILGGGSSLDFPALYDLGSILFAFFYILLLRGLLEEKFGWRDMPSIGLRRGTKRCFPA